MRKKSRWSLMIGLGVTAVGITLVAANATSSPFGSLPAAKQQIESNYAQLEQNSHMASKSSDTSLKPVHHDQLPSGIINEFAPPFRADDVVISNLWQQQVNDVLTQVYVGKVSSDQSQGIVIVQTTLPDGETTQEQRIVTPEKVGSLKITAATGQKLTLVSEQGTVYQFDVQAKGLTKK